MGCYCDPGEVGRNSEILLTSMCGLHHKHALTDKRDVTKDFDAGNASTRQVQPGTRVRDSPCGRQAANCVRSTRQLLCNTTKPHRALLFRPTLLQDLVSVMITRKYV